MCESVLTQTRPCPPPAAGVAVGAARGVAAPLAFAEAVVVVVGATAGAGLSDFFGLKKSASVFFAGEGDVVGEAAAVVFALRACFSAGEGDAAVVAAGEGEVAAALSGLENVFVLRVRFSAGEGDSVLAAAGEAVLLASAFL
jgi:hypothetical protein